MSDGKHSSSDQSTTYHPPKDGLSAGSKWGFIITLIAILVLFYLVFITGTPPGSGRAIVADFVLAAGLGALGVYGIGGMIEIGGKLFDFSVKAGGGIAIIVLVMFVVRPFHSADINTSYDEEFEVAADGTIGVLLETYNDQFLKSERDAIQVIIPEENKEKILNFKAEQIGKTAIYRANWDLLRRRNPRIALLKIIEERQSCLSFEEISDHQVRAIIDDSLTIRNEVDDGTIYTCTPK